VFEAEHDPETNFKLFGPVVAERNHAAGTSRAFALRLRPNQDFANALEGFCRARGIARAKIHGGVGSIVGARYVDGRIIEPFATEMAVRGGAIMSIDGTPQAELDVALVDHSGGLSGGKLIRGDNPVLMTMELVLEAIA
jgi:predicted DNA-binding protein with PD1-like motif